MLSIVTPVLDGAKYIEDNIRSIKTLDIPHEHIIVDGGSSDGTIEIVNNYDHLILLHQKEKSGMYGAIFQGFSLSKAKYLAYVNADDKIIKKGFEKMYHTINEKKLDLVYSNAYFSNTVNDKLLNVKANRFAKYFLTRGYMPFVQPSSIYSRKCYENVGGLRYEKFKISGDLDLFQRIALNKESKIEFIDEYSTIFLKNPESLGNTNAERHQLEFKFLEYQNYSFFNSIAFKLSKFL